MINSKETDSIYTLQFALVCLSSFLFSASFNMLIPELPAYLSAMGGASYKGLIIALFTLTAGFSRPFSGKLTDTIGRVPVMAVGSIVCFLSMSCSKTIISLGLNKFILERPEPSTQRKRSGIALKYLSSIYLMASVKQAHFLTIIIRVVIWSLKRGKHCAFHL